ncbi:MAG: hypothetical protein JSU86_18570 [Phycisphaerales bacterium]|nr:MAG: hypothetical protein JSU86_18570 [Phycisphaerales bacterium]
MTYRGRIINGVVVLDGAVSLSEGTIVRVEPIDQPKSDGDGSVYERIARIAGKVKGLPSDLARQHDHYLHGQPRV